MKTMALEDDMGKYKNKYCSSHFLGAALGITPTEVNDIKKSVENTAQRLSEGALQLGIKQLNKFIGIEEKPTPITEDLHKIKSM